MWQVHHYSIHPQRGKVRWSLREIQRTLKKILVKADRIRFHSLLQIGLAIIVAQISSITQISRFVARVGVDETN